jgi:hypothetical protein
LSYLLTSRSSLTAVQPFRSQTHLCSSACRATNNEPINGVAMVGSGCQSQFPSDACIRHLPGGFGGPDSGIKTLFFSSATDGTTTVNGDSEVNHLKLSSQYVSVSFK